MATVLSIVGEGIPHVSHVYVSLSDFSEEQLVREFCESKGLAFDNALIYGISTIPELYNKFSNAIDEFLTGKGFICEPVRFIKHTYELKEEDSSDCCTIRVGEVHHTVNTIRKVKELVGCSLNTATFFIRNGTYFEVPHSPEAVERAFCGIATIEIQ